MCGITGLFSLGGQLKPGYIEHMTNVLNHRGPDSEGYFKDHDIHLGSRRLSIIDVQNGNQPIYNEDQSIVTVLNGEIFNFIELRDELVKRGHHFRTQTDTEVLVHLYEDFGKSIVNKLEGQFAFAIYDKKKVELFLARDRMGICPLYFCIINNVLYFSSEIKSFAQLEWFNGNPDILGLAQSLKYWTTISPRTIFEQVSVLPIAHFMIANQFDNVKMVRYHCLVDYENEFKIKDFNELKELVRSNIYNSVKKRLISDKSVRVGAYVSGGIDSAIITHLINQIGLNDYTTFSLSFEDSSCDESVYQKECVKNLNSNHIEIKITNNQIVESFPETIRHTEFPFFRTAPVPMFLLSKVVKDNNRKVVLSGEGADEIFYGYDIFKEVLVRRFWANNRSSKFRSDKLGEIYYYDQVNNQIAFDYLKQFYLKSLDNYEDPLYPLLPQWQNGEGLYSFFSKDCREIIATKNSNQDLINLFPSQLWSLSPLKRCQGLQMELLLGGYLLSSQGDRVLNANSVEGRYPFLDEKVVFLACNIPEPLKLYGLNEKYILRESFKGIIPEIIRNRKKFPYHSPEAKIFFNKNFNDCYVSDLLSERSINEFGLFDYKKLRLLVDKFKDNDDVSCFSTRDNLIMIYILGVQLLFKLARKKFNQIYY
jgi:asparagine synthase (glutamine-hydrolysing)